MSEGNSYGQILRSSSIMGGAQAINYVIGLIRVKAVAVLLGPAGVGIIGLYTSATNVLGTVTEVGLRGSSVRCIAEANGRGDTLAVARTTRMLRRLCWATGVLGWLASAALAIPLSQWMFKSTEHAWALGVLGGMLLLNAINGGQLGLLQGIRRIGDIARVQVASTIVNTAITVALYAWLHQRGIVPVMLLNAAVSLSMSWWFARRVRVVPVCMGWKTAVAEAKPLLGLGVAMMWAGVLGLLVDLVTRGLISRHLGVDAAGIYQAAWALSGTFAGFVLSAMGYDFYPRLTAVIRDHAAAAREVNEQTEIGILLALPGLLIILALAKWVIWALYSAKFAAAANVLAWMVLGMFGRVVSWPLGYIQLAAGAGSWFMVTEATSLALEVAFVIWFVPRFGVVGAAYAFALSYALYTPAMMWVGRRLIGFRWSAVVWRIVSVSAVLIVLALAANQLLPEVPATAIGCVVAVLGSLWCLRGLAKRLDKDHRLVRWMKHVPGSRYLLGV
ncbi:MAG TPA: O-antigen translocase [Nitrococcus sp.]|nr:O-antigen translocase [Nitrococcus sp.]